MVYIHQGTKAQTPPFVERLDPDSVTVADPDAELYQAFGVDGGGWRAMFGLRSWLAGIRATFRGHRIGRKVGDPWTLPLVVAVRDRQVVWEHRGTFAGDHPDVDTIPTKMTPNDVTR
ncbi:MAG: AhpC/TSA family protein [Actinomycetota bacterium]